MYTFAVSFFLCIFVSRCVYDHYSLNVDATVELFIYIFLLVHFFAFLLYRECLSARATIHLIWPSFISSSTLIFFFSSQFVCESAGVRSDNNKYNDNIEITSWHVWVCVYTSLQYCIIAISTEVKSSSSTQLNRHEFVKLTTTKKKETRNVATIVNRVCVFSIFWRKSLYFLCVWKYVCVRACVRTCVCVRVY